MCFCDGCGNREDNKVDKTYRRRVKNRNTFFSNF